MPSSAQVDGKIRLPSILNLWLISTYANMTRQRRQFSTSLHTFLLAAFLPGTILCLGQSDPKSAPKLEPGVAVTFTARDGATPAVTDVVVLPHAALYVPAGQSPTPFLPAGKFDAEWSGFISVELRDNFTFQAEMNGGMKLEINGTVVLEASGSNTNTPTSKPIRLNKGTNAFTLRFVSPTEGDAFIRLLWSSREFPLEPVSSAVLNHEPNPGLEKSEQRRKGRELFVEFRCGKCHLAPAASGIPELAMDAPALDGIGSRRNFDWMYRWILDPKSLRPTAHMPKVLHGTTAKEDAATMASYLASLTSSAPPSSAVESTPDGVASGRKLFATLHCAACHNDPSSTEADPAKVSLGQVAEKFRPGRLAEFLRKPDSHYTWIRMPDFKLTADEAAQLAAYLGSVADKPGENAAPTDAAVVNRGQKLVQNSGCLNCHSVKSDHAIPAGPPVELRASGWAQGCLADAPAESSNAPRFGFDTSERDALRAFGATDRASLTRHVPTEFAQRQTRLLNCRECHGKFEGFPPLDVLGGKLRPEWSRSFIAGEIATKPRFWLEARMPAFRARAEGLAQGLAMLHGYPPLTPAEPPIDDEAAKVGQKLVAAPPDGFACVQCHGVAGVGATQVFESNGINLALTGERMLKAYYLRWLRNPLRIDPASKMPVYFDEEGRSPLTDVYGGDGPRQSDAIWQYLRLGDKMPPPPGTQAPP